MSSRLERLFNRRTTRSLLLTALFLALVASRRWEQFLAPQVWCEDGQLILGFLHNGWREFLEPLNGYLVLAPKAVTRISMEVSAVYYPLISTILSTMFAALVGLAVAMSPTHLRNRLLCAVSVFLVPSDPEVFGAPLYLLWWAPVLLFVVALWDERSAALWPRLLFVLLGGLSSPVILVILPVFLYRAVRHRGSRPERIVAIAATTAAAVQLSFILKGASAGLPPLASLIRYFVPRFCGWFLVGNLSDNIYLLWASGVLLLALVLGFLCRNRRSAWSWILVYLLLGAAASSMMRTDPAALHPVRGGPRYFFLPFIMLFWILLEFALAADRKWVRGLLVRVLVVVAVNAIPVWSRQHDDLEWRPHIISARLFPVYDVPIQSDGHWFGAWSIRLSGKDSGRFLSGDMLISGAQLANEATFAYRVLRREEISGSKSPEAQYRGNNPRAHQVISTSTVGGRDLVTLRLSAGDRIRFRSGSAAAPVPMRVVGHEGSFIQRLPRTTDWVTLEFSNSNLPRNFEVRVGEDGQGAGEWAEALTDGGDHLVRSNERREL